MKGASLSAWGDEKGGEGTVVADCGDITFGEDLSVKVIGVPGPELVGENNSDFTGT